MQQFNGFATGVIVVRHVAEGERSSEGEGESAKGGEQNEPLPALGQIQQAHKTHGRDHVEDGKRVEDESQLLVGEEGVEEEKGENGQKNAPK